MTTQGPVLGESHGARAAAPTLRASGLRLRDAGGAELELSSEFEASASSLVLLGGATTLAQALVEPSAILSGSLLLAGRAPAELLASGEAGYAPPRLPAPDGFRLERTLELAARLTGLGRRETARALERVALGARGRRRLGELSPLEQRLSGLALGLLSEPALLVVEDPFDGLDEAAAEAMATLLDEALRERHWVVGARAESPAARRLLERASAVVVARAGRLLGPLPPRELVAGGLWLRATAADALARALESKGARVTCAPRGGVLFVCGSSGLGVLDAAAEAGATVLSLCPEGADAR